MGGTGSAIHAFLPKVPLISKLAAGGLNALETDIIDNGWVKGPVTGKGKLSG